MRIRMLSTQRGSPDGVSLHLYSEGSEHDLSGTKRERFLASVFIEHGHAEAISAVVPEEAAPVEPQRAKEVIQHQGDAKHPAQRAGRRR